MRLIDADALMDGEFPEVENEYQMGWNDGLRGAMIAAPTVDAVPVVHSAWEIITDEYGNELMRCPVCRSEFYDGDNDTVDTLHNYCPNCGSRMDGRTK